MVRSKPLLSFLFATCLVVPAFSQLEPSWPPDSNAYTRKAIAEDKRPAGNLAIKALQFGTPTFSDVFIRDTVVSNGSPRSRRVRGAVMMAGQPRKPSALAGLRGLNARPPTGQHGVQQSRFS